MWAWLKFLECLRQIIPVFLEADCGWQQLWIICIFKYSFIQMFSSFSTCEWKEGLQSSASYLTVHLSACHSHSNSFWMCWSVLIKFEKGIETSKAITFLWASWKPASVLLILHFFAWYKPHDSPEKCGFLFIFSSHEGSSSLGSFYSDHNWRRMRVMENSQYHLSDILSDMNSVSSKSILCALGNLKSTN